MSSSVILLHIQSKGNARNLVDFQSLSVESLVPHRGHTPLCVSVIDLKAETKAAWERQALHEAGLGEKKILFTNVDCNAEDYREKLLEEFPKLKDGGGFELLRCSANSRVLEPISSVALQSPRATQERVGRSKVYIRPIQADLDMTADNTENMTSQVLSYCTL